MSKIELIFGGPPLTQERLEGERRTIRLSPIVTQIRERWEDCRWPKIGYFVHGQARMDIRELLAEIDRLNAL